MDRTGLIRTIVRFVVLGFAGVGTAVLAANAGKPDPYEGYYINSWTEQGPQPALQEGRPVGFTSAQR